MSVSPTNGNGPKQRQRKTLTRAGIEPTTLDHGYSTDWATRSEGSRWWELKMSMSWQSVADPDLEVRWRPALKHFDFSLSQFWCFMVFSWLWSKNNGGNVGTRGCGDRFSKYRISEMGEHPNAKLNCLCYFSKTIIRILFKYQLNTYQNSKIGFSNLSTSRHPSQNSTVKQSRRPNGPLLWHCSWNFKLERLLLLLLHKCLSLMTSSL